MIGWLITQASQSASLMDLTEEERERQSTAQLVSKFSSSRHCHCCSSFILAAVTRAWEARPQRRSLCLTLHACLASNFVLKNVCCLAYLCFGWCWQRFFKHNKRWLHFWEVKTEKKILKWGFMWEDKFNYRSKAKMSFKQWWTAEMSSTMVTCLQLRFSNPFSIFTVSCSILLTVTNQIRSEACVDWLVWNKVEGIVYIFPV